MATFVCSNCRVPSQSLDVVACDGMSRSSCANRGSSVESIAASDSAGYIGARDQQAAVDEYRVTRLLALHSRHRHELADRIIGEHDWRPRVQMLFLHRRRGDEIGCNVKELRSDGVGRSRQGPRDASRDAEENHEYGGRDAHDLNICAMMPRKPHVRIDLRQATLEELIAFVFDHPEPPIGPNGAPDYWCWTVDLEVEIDPAHQVALMTELFRDARALSPRFSAAQIDQGLWFMFSGGSEWFSELLADRELSWAPRRAAIRAIYDLYDGLLARVEVESATYMLWDLLLDKFEDDFTEIGETSLETLVRILSLPQVECQAGALHGLGHLKHPQTERVVSEYLRDQRPTDPDLLRYAERVRRGDGVL